MQYFSLDKYRDSIILVARILLMILFVLFGWQKLIGFQGTVEYVKHLALPLPVISAAISVLVEFFFGLMIVLGYYTRPIALIYAVYTLATGFVGHPYWTMSGQDAYMATINFYKNVSIAGGLLLLAVTGAGKYSIDRK